MIDNTAHDILVQAADEVGWNEETMLLMATRFIARLGGEDPTILEKLEVYLQEQVAEENDYAVERVPARATAPAAKEAGARSPRSKPAAANAGPGPVVGPDHGRRRS